MGIFYRRDELRRQLASIYDKFNNDERLLRNVIINLTDEESDVCSLMNYLQNELNGNTQHRTSYEAQLVALQRLTEEEAEILNFLGDYHRTVGLDLTKDVARWLSE